MSRSNSRDYRITNTGFSYDAAGNLTGDGTNTYAYDGANRIKQLNTSTATYTYSVRYG